MTKVINNEIGKLIEYSSYFYKLKNDEVFLFSEVNKITKQNLKILKDNYVNRDKVNKIRFEVICLLYDKEEELTIEKFEEIKNDVNDMYQTNILQSWKASFSILYTLLYFPIKDTVMSGLKKIGNYVIKELNIQNVKLKIQGFDGGQNFGADSCWLAIYNEKQKNQSSSLQIFLHFYNNIMDYGLFEYFAQTPYKTKFEQQKESINVNQLLEDVKTNVIDIENDTLTRSIIIHSLRV